MATKKVDFRKLKEQRETLKNKRKIDSPLAKYNSSGQLFCVLCNAPIKSELLWAAHVQSKKHKEIMVSLKTKNSKQSEPQVAEQRKPPMLSNDGQKAYFAKPSALSAPKKINKRTLIKDYGNDDDDDDAVPSKKSKESAEPQLKSSSLPANFFDGPETTTRNSVPSERPSNETPSASTTGLPADFFDDQKTTTTEAGSPSSGPSQTSKRKSSEDIPEGFFDDPKLDAKARKVEYKDPQDEEWEKFQKAIQMENQVSEALVEEDDEVARIDRQLTELNEQREYFLRANMLRDKQTIIQEQIIKETQERREQQVMDDSSSDSEDFDELFDWRAKKVV